MTPNNNDSNSRNDELRSLIGRPKLNKMRYGLRARLLDIIKLPSMPETGKTESNESLVTLGTIDLGSIHDCEKDDFDIDENHGLSCCGHALHVDHYFSSQDCKKSPDQSGKDRSDSDDCSCPKTKVHSKYTYQMTNQNNISSLIVLGMRYYSIGFYKEAMETQQDALLLLNESINIEKASSSSQSYNPLRRQKSIIRFEIAKIEFVVFKELSYESTDESTQVQLTNLFEKMQTAKCIATLHDLSYYKSELSSLKDQDEDNNTKKLFHKLHILHSLAKICHKDLFLYQDALNYYNSALELECLILSDLIQCTGKSKKLHEEEIKDLRTRIRRTKRKIGACYYRSGRFDLALLTSFSLDCSSTAHI